MIEDPLDAGWFIPLVAVIVCVYFLVQGLVEEYREAHKR
jgi:hypothetical protein